MKQKLLFLGVVVAVVIAGAAVYLIATNDPASAPATLTPNKGGTVGKLETTQQTVAVVGTVKCLAPSENAATQASSCALGLQQDDGGTYALEAKDPTTTGSLVNQRVKVTGVVTPKATSYNADGVIEVQSVTPVQ